MFSSIPFEQLAVGPPGPAEPFVFDREKALRTIVEANLSNRFGESRRPSLAVAVASPGMGKSTMLDRFLQKKYVQPCVQQSNCSTAPKAEFEALDFIGIATTFGSDTALRDFGADEVGSPKDELLIRVLLE